MMVNAIPRRLHPLTDAGGAAPAFARREGGAEELMGSRVKRSNQWTPVRIRKLRMKLQLTQEDFGHLIGVSFATVNRWENGRNPPNKKAQRVLAKAEKGKLKPARAGLVLPNAAPPRLPEIVTFATAVKWVRDRYDLSQENFAYGIGVTFSTINKWENGKGEPNELTKKVLREAAETAQAPKQIIGMLM